MIQVACNGNSARCTGIERLTSGMVGLQCEFVFDSAWDGLARTAVFVAGSVQRDVLLTGDTCNVPWEVLKTAGYHLTVGVYGTNADGTLGSCIARSSRRIPSTACTHRVSVRKACTAR